MVSRNDTPDKTDITSRTRAKKSNNGVPAEECRDNVEDDTDASTSRRTKKASPGNTARVGATKGRQDTVEDKSVDEEEQAGGSRRSNRLQKNPPGKQLSRRSSVTGSATKNGYQNSPPMEFSDKIRQDIGRYVSEKSPKERK